MLLRGASSDMHSTAEVDRLQQEVELLRIKDLQQEHHINMLTQQLRSQQAESPQLDATRPVLQSSVSAKWHEWHQRRSQSPEPFHRPLAHKFQPQSNQQGNPNRPALRERRSRVKPTCNSLEPDTTTAAKAASSPGRHQSHFQISAVMGASGKLSRSRGTFGSEHRWYQPTQAADKAAALTQEALAAAAAEQQLNHANWLLKSSPVAQSKSAQRCTFGSQLRWWERVSQPQQTVSGWPNSDQAVLHAELYGYQASLEHRGQYIGRVSPVRGPGVPQQGSTFGTEPRGLDADAPRPALRPQTSAVAAALAAAKANAAPSEQSISPLPAGLSQRSESVDRGLRQAQVSVSPERAWWSADPAPSPDSALQRIQHKHAQIQSLAALINQRPTSARTHTLKSTFGSEARWWENPIAERASSPSSQQSGAASKSSPDRAGGSSAHRVASPDRSTGQKLHSTFGSERRWWETRGHSTAAASHPQLQQPDAERTDAAVKAVAALWSPRQPDLVKPAASSCNDGDQWWQGSQERGSLEGSLRQRCSEPVERARAPPPPPTAHPLSMSNSAQQVLIERLDAQPWNTASVQAEPGVDAGAETGSRSRHQSARQSAGSLSPPARAESTRSASRCVSPSGSMQHIKQIRRRSSSKSELQDTLSYRSTERQRLEHVRSPHAREWAKSLRDLSTELQPSFQRSDSRKQARELQQEFLQKAKEDLEAFQQTPLRSSQASVPQSRASLEDTGISVDVDQQREDAGGWNVHTVQERPRTTLEKRLEKQLSRGSRQGSGASKQGQAWQGSSIRLSRQASTMKVALQRQQQQLAAQQAESRLAAFQQAAERHNAEAARRRQQQAAAKAAQPVVPRTAPHVSIRPAMRAATQLAAGAAVASPAKLTAHSSLPSTNAQACVQRVFSQTPLFRSVSWADHSELQEPPHDDSFELAHITDPMVLHTPDIRSQTALMQPVGLALSPPVDPVVAKSGATAKYGSLSGDFQTQTAKLDAYYKAKQSPVQAEPSSTSAACTSHDAETSDLSVAQRSAMFAALEAKSGARQASTGLPRAESATAGSEVALGPPARRASLVVPESMRQNKAHAFSPGKPGLKSQLSKMMEEVAQARSEVQGLQSQLSVHSRLGQRSGSTASSVAGSDHSLDGVCCGS
ncbi:hypothetical protein WJX77_007571 [Trebouxia sp. C0004]